MITSWYILGGSQWIRRNPCYNWTSTVLTNSLQVGRTNPLTNWDEPESMHIYIYNILMWIDLYMHALTSLHACIYICIYIGICIWIYTWICTCIHIVYTIIYIYIVCVSSLSKKVEELLGFNAAGVCSVRWSIPRTVDFSSLSSVSLVELDVAWSKIDGSTSIGRVEIWKYQWYLYICT